jgi:signal peptidase I
MYMSDFDSKPDHLNDTGDTQDTSENFTPSPFWDFIRIFLIAAAIIIPIRLFLFQPFIVTGNSMLPNFHDADYLIVCEICYRVDTPHRGDVVVLRAPTSHLFFIKRVIGLPGEHLEIRDGIVRITTTTNPPSEQTIVLEEPYLANGTYTYGNFDVVLGSGEYYVLGDNRSESSDSRVFGPVKRRALIGRVLLRAYPFGDVAIFPTLEYAR